MQGSHFYPELESAHLSSERLAGQVENFFRVNFVIGYDFATEAQMKKKSQISLTLLDFWGDRWGSNPRQLESQSRALPAELRPPLNCLSGTWCARLESNQQPPA